MKKDGIYSDSNNKHILYPFLISFVAAVGGFIFGYDLNIIAGAQRYLKDVFELSPQAFGFANASALLGCLAGPIVGAWLCDLTGRKKSLMVAAVLFGISAIGTAIPRNIIEFNIFRIIGGVGVGLASVASPMYIAEIAPKKIRGMLVTMNQLAIVVGALSAIIVSYFLAEYVSAKVSWRWMFASELVPIILFVIFLSMIPETPRWLAEKRQFGQSLKILTKLHGATEAEIEMAGIRNETIGLRDAARVSFGELFTPGIRVAIILGIVLSLMSQWTGWSIVAIYMPTIYAQAGITVRSEAIFWTIIPNLANLVYTFIAIYLVDRAGRRPLYLVCTLLMAVMMSVLGLVFVLGIKGWPVVVILSLVGAPHAIAIGGLTWLVVSEIFPTHIRAKAMSFCTVFLWVACFIVIFAAPPLFELSMKWFGVPSGLFFLCGIISLASFLFVLKKLPETKGKTLEEIGDVWTVRSKSNKAKADEMLIEN